MRLHIVLLIAATLVSSSARADIRQADLDSSLVRAIANGDQRSITQLLALGANIRQPGRDGSPAHAAVASDRPLLLRQMLDGGANPDGRGANGQTALTQATLQDAGDMVTMLLAAGAAVDARNAAGQTPLHLAARLGRPALARALILAGARTDLATPAGESALLLAARAGGLGIVEMLLKAGADPDRVDRVGHTALIAAQIEGHEAIAVRLVEAGARIDLPVGSYSLAHLARANRLTRLLEALARRSGAPLP